MGRRSDRRPGRGRGPGRRAGGVPRGRSAAPARRRRPLPDSRVHSDFSAHFSSSPVTPALALPPPPPAAPPRSASRGNPATAGPGVQPAPRRSAPRSPAPAPRVPSRATCPRPVVPTSGTAERTVRQRPSLGDSTGAWLSTSGPRLRFPYRRHLGTDKTSMWTRTFPQELPSPQESLGSDLRLELGHPRPSEFNPESETSAVYLHPSLRHPKMRTLGPATICLKPPAQDTDRIREMGSVTPT